MFKYLKKKKTMKNNDNNRQIKSLKLLYNRVIIVTCLTMFTFRTHLIND